MPYIDTSPALFRPKIREDNIQEALGELLKNHGWTVAKRFTKLVCSSHFMSDSHPPSARHDECFAGAEHFIFRNSNAKMFGVAVVAEFEEFSDHDNIMPYYDWKQGTPQEKEELVNWLYDKFDENKANTSLYFYMVEREPDFQNGGKYLVPWGGEEFEDIGGTPNHTYTDEEKAELLRMALDVEVVETDFADGSQESLYIKNATPIVMQSPICKATLRPDFVESIEYPVMTTNWWSDSEVTLRGYIDSKSVFVTIMADNVPLWENNLVPVIPFYFGNIVPLDEGDEAVALFSGTVPPGKNSEDVAKFDFDSIARGGERIMPILKSYPSKPSNGLDSVMLSRSKYGSRYQEYFLSWNAAPDAMPPRREDATGRKYPRAYENNTEIYKYQFSPSKYSGKVHTSMVYLTHPEEGVRGHLDKAIGLNSTNFSAGRLRVLKDNCPGKVYDVYKYLPVSGLSPLTKKPGTPYRPMGLGIYESEFDPNNPANNPDPNDTTPPEEVSNLTASSQISSTIDISWTPPADADFSHINIYREGSSQPHVYGVVGVTKYRLAGLQPGSLEKLRITTVDINGNESNGIETEQIQVKD